MKKYNKPCIKSIPLDPDQAVLEVCKVGGAYFSNTVQCKYHGTGLLGPFFACPVPVKGVATITIWNRNDLTQQPS
ncbi:MAG: hypothetical protein PHQ52_05305 [Candidatus Omnitrophica bacterium]|nr:hypothetical protein [Candidatus Omnitrophota bacterium]